MKALSIIIGAATLALFLGCDSKSPPGGPNATKAKESTRVGMTDNTFEVTVPMTETSINQGETKKISIGMKRGKNFDQDVDLKFSELPNGVKVDPMQGTLKAGEKEWQVSIIAAPDAALGHHDFNVIATPKTGSPTTTTIKVEVKKP